jgi:hypothetical protein
VNAERHPYYRAVTVFVDQGAGVLSARRQALSPRLVQRLKGTERGGVLGRRVGFRHGFLLVVAPTVEAIRS